VRILWLKTEFLHPVDKGGRIRTYQMLREIANRHHVTYLTLDDGLADRDATERAREYAAEVVRVPFSPPPKGTLPFYSALLGNLGSPLPYAVGRYRSAEMERAVQEHAQHADLVICDFLAPAVNVPHQLACPVLLFQHNVESMIWERHTAVATSAVKKAYMNLQWQRMERFEGQACRRFDHVVAVSPIDSQVMRERFGVTAVSDVPTGVDTEYFTPEHTNPRRRVELVFTGSMDWMPNDDAMRWFLAEILPRIRASLPETTLTIVGRSPSATVRSLAEKLPSVEVTGRVPDVRPYLDRASVFIVPMRVGGGTRLKIFEAMSMGLPVVSTAIGAEGLPLVDGVSGCLRDDPGRFADAVVTLLRDDAMRRRIADTGQQQVREKYGWSGVADAFMETCQQVVQSFGQRGTSQR